LIANLTAGEQPAIDPYQDQRRLVGARRPAHYAASEAAGIREEDAMNTQLIRYEVQDYIAVVTMDHPPVNAQNQQFHLETTRIFDALSEDENVRAAILTGAGKCFSAGADIKARLDRSGELGEGWQHNRRARNCFYAIMECTKPTIAAINGPCLGAGLAVAASCDILLAAEEASVGLPEINVGLLGGGRHSMRLFGHSRTRRMMFTGLRMSGQELYRLGVVEACVPGEKLIEEAMKLAREIAGKSPIAIKLAKHALNTIEDMTIRDGYQFEQGMTAELSKYEDSREAMRAFVEKRAPVFKGR
jgi:enoyl-CoA hydratase/carnithine racemase